jgi:hypothetical protein
LIDASTTACGMCACTLSDPALFHRQWNNRPDLRHQRRQLLDDLLRDKTLGTLGLLDMTFSCFGTAGRRGTTALVHSAGGHTGWRMAATRRHLRLMFPRSAHTMAARGRLRGHAR